MIKQQGKVILLVLAVLVAALIALGWQTRQLVIDERTSAAADATLKQIAPLKRLVQGKIESERDHVVRFATGRMVQGAGRETSFGSFDVIAVVEPNGETWTPAWVERGGGAKATAWPAQYELTLLKSLPYAKTKEGEIYWARVSDAQGAPVYALLIPVDVQVPPTTTSASAGALAGANLPDNVNSATALPTMKKAVIVGFASTNVLAGVVEDFIGSSSAAYVVDDQGYVASHVDKSYVGALFTEDNIVKAILKGDRTSGSGRFTDFDGHNVLAHFEKIDHTNLFAVMTTPVAVIQQPVDTILRALLITSGLILLFGLIAAWIFGLFVKPDAAEGAPVFKPKPVTPAPPPPKREDDEIVPPPPTSAPSMEVLEQERRAAFEEFSTGVDEAVREPLLAILGHAQLLKSKTDDPDVRSHAESLERDARAAKTTLDLMRGFSAPLTPIPVSSKVSLNDVLLGALADVDDLLSADVIKVNQETSYMPEVIGDADEIQTAVVCLLKNAIESVHNRDVKEITITLEYRDNNIFFAFSDTGVGMNRDIQTRAFEPFVKGFESPAHLGLGLAHVDKMIRHHGGKVELDSVPGSGTTITLVFPVDGDDLRRFQQDQSTRESTRTEVDSTSEEPAIEVPPAKEKIPAFVAPIPLPAMDVAADAGPPPIKKPMMSFKLQNENPSETVEDADSVVTTASSPFASILMKEPQADGSSDESAEPEANDSTNKKPEEDTFSKPGADPISFFSTLKPLASEHVEKMPPAPVDHDADEMDSVAFAQISEMDRVKGIGPVHASDSDNSAGTSTEIDTGSIAPAVAAASASAPTSIADFQVKIRRPKPKGS